MQTFITTFMSLDNLLMENPMTFSECFPLEAIILF